MQECIREANGIYQECTGQGKNYQRNLTPSAFGCIYTVCDRKDENSALLQDPHMHQCLKSP